MTIVSDHGTIGQTMKQIPISKFKATCLGVLEQVRKTRQPVLVTKFGKPVARIVPPPPGVSRRQILGFMAGRVQIQGDIVHANPWEDAEGAHRK